MEKIEIKNIGDLEKIICEIENGDILLKVQDSKLVYAEVTKKIKPKNISYSQIGKIRLAKVSLFLCKNL